MPKVRLPGLGKGHFVPKPKPGSCPHKNKGLDELVELSEWKEVCNPKPFTPFRRDRWFHHFPEKEEQQNRKGEKNV